MLRHDSYSLLLRHALDNTYYHYYYEQNYGLTL